MSQITTHVLDTAIGKPAEEIVITLYRPEGQSWIEIGKGGDPTTWEKVSNVIKKPVESGILDDLAAGHFRGAREWTVRVITEHKNRQRREARFNLTLG